MPLQENPDLGTAYAHAGILAAAKAVWSDLEEHGILDVLLDKSEAQKAEPPGGPPSGSGPGHIDKAGPPPAAAVAAAVGSGAGDGTGLKCASGASGSFVGDEDSMERGTARSAAGGAPGGEVQLNEVCNDLKCLCHSPP